MKSLTDKQKIFVFSKANGGLYVEPEPYPIKWPADTWLQRRRRELAEQEEGDKENG